MSAPALAPAATPLLDARDVQVSIGDKPIVHAADLSVAPGELVAVVGPNGAGKSTLVRAVAGLQKASGGSVRWSGEDLAAIKPRRLALLRAFVPQRSAVPEGLTVADAVAIGRAPHLGPFTRPGRHDHEAVERALRRAGVAPLAERRLTTLSGGELQRAQIAVALAQEAPALIADEPTSHLDLGATAEAAELLQGLARHDGLGVLLVVHDLALAAAVADRAVVVHQGRTVADGPPATVLDRARLAEVWRVDAELQTSGPGRAALHVDYRSRARQDSLIRAP